ncbi:MAG: TIGR03905 family TSCPD domain-containing protein [Coriobacteriia bacterium]|nr:TIGR03905 family TSCPD domain-containing protein [Coriobacteriia bacterium]MBS5479220.1 TIGR03905 family TSCPD domain-containing protein [Coriobacteriia bacterium]
MISTDFTPHGVCSTNIHVELSDDGSTIERVEFTRGCDGNLRAISKLVKGMPTDKVVELLEGNHCGKRPTSCADQLTKALREAQLVASAR